MQTLSDKLGDNQYGTCLVTCHDCGEDFEIKLERKSENTLEYSGGIIAKNKHNKKYLNSDDKHTIANEAAEHFLKLLCDQYKK